MTETDRFDEEDIEKQYTVESDGVPARVTIGEPEDEYVLLYLLERPEIDEATEALLNDIRKELIQEVSLTTEEFVDSKALDEVKEKFRRTASEILENRLAETNDQTRSILIGNLIHDMLGLGDIELLLSDNSLEEIVVNGSDECAWVYHKELGWLKTNVFFEDEDEIYNYSSEIGRQVGKEINSLHPLLDAHLPSGDRVNSTLYPISTQGNTITIRKFARDPWTITDFIQNGTMDPEAAAFIWLCMQYELNVIVSGGTGAGKCLTPESKLTKPDGTRESIQDLVERNMDDRTEIEDGWRASSSEPVLSMTGNHHIQAQDAETCWKREAPEQMYRIRTESGREIETTPEHPFFVNTQGEVRKLRADEIEEGTHIPSPKKIDIDNRDQKLEVREWLEDRDIELRGETESGVFAGPARGKTVRLPVKISPALAKLAGLVAGDGHPHSPESGSHRVELHNSNTQVLECFKNLAGQLFEVEATIKERDQRVDAASLYSKAVLEFLEDTLGIPAGKKSGRIRIPDRIVKSSDGTLSSFLKGFFEAEAHVNENKSNIEVTSKSKEVIQQTATGLKRFGIFSRIKQEATDEAKYHRLLIGPESLEKFDEHIGFISTEKSGALEGALEGERNTNKDTVPCQKALRKAKQVARLTDQQLAEKSGTSRRAVSRYMDGGRTPSTDTASRLVDALRQRKTEIEEAQKQLEELVNKAESSDRQELKDRLVGGMESGELERKDIEAEAGISSSLITHWKQGAIPTPEKLDKAVKAASIQGFSHEFNRIDYDSALRTIQRIRTDLGITQTEIKEETGVDLQPLENRRNRTTKRQKIEKASSYLREECRRAIKKLPREVRRLRELADGDIRWDEVRRVTSFRPETDWVYDLSVPENQTFVAEGLVAHNTSLLNVLMPFIPPNQRVLSIEDTREISLPSFLHWVPTTTREPNPEGKGGVSMLDLLVNALRMRPDRILVGEIREEKQAEVLFEAMHTGHSVYSTLHADDAEQTVRRLVNPPIDVPKTMVTSVDLNVVMFRDRRRNYRRVMEVAEVVENEEEEAEENVVYKWDSDTDETNKISEAGRVYEKLRTFTGMDAEEIDYNIQEKQDILEWMVENGVDSVDGVGRTVAEYYQRPEEMVEMIREGTDPEEIEY
ncbi:helix-turn-helix domain-containing protein [Nanohaloarchaea archaeon]|nr:helix-turn-helix domain-containing protein [Candidatus Nanohaloarchaea archaeon]